MTTRVAVVSSYEHHEFPHDVNHGKEELVKAEVGPGALASLGLMDQNVLRISDLNCHLLQCHNQVLLAVSVF
jgi:hypothetical protein